MEKEKERKPIWQQKMSGCAVIAHNHVEAVLVIWSVQKISEMFAIILQNASIHGGKSIERKMENETKTKIERNWIHSSTIMIKERILVKSSVRILPQCIGLRRWSKRQPGQCGTCNMQRSEAQWKLIASYKASTESKESKYLKIHEKSKRAAQLDHRHASKQTRWKSKDIGKQQLAKASRCSKII